MVGSTHRITTKGGNVLPHPVDTKTLVLQREVFLLAIAETEDVQSIVYRNKNQRPAGFDGICDESGWICTPLVQRGTSGMVNALTADFGCSGAESDNLRATWYIVKRRQ